MTDTRETPTEIARKKLAALIEDYDDRGFYQDDSKVLGRIGRGTEEPPMMTWSDLKALATPDTTDKIETGAGGLVKRIEKVAKGLDELEANMISNDIDVRIDAAIPPSVYAEELRSILASLSPTGDGGRARGKDHVRILVEAVNERMGPLGDEDEDDEDVSLPPSGITFGMIRRALDQLSQAGAGEQGGGASREGWVLVPREPTLGMVAKGWLAAHRVVTHDRCNHEMLRDAYGAMLDAAQSLTTRGEG